MPLDCDGKAALQAAASRHQAQRAPTVIARPRSTMRQGAAAGPASRPPRTTVASTSGTTALSARSPSGASSSAKSASTKAGRSAWLRSPVKIRESGRSAEVFNPATGEAEKRVPLASAAELDAAVANARAAQPAWAAVNPHRRARVLLTFVELPPRDMDTLAEALSSQPG